MAWAKAWRRSQRYQATRARSASTSPSLGRLPAARHCCSASWFGGVSLLSLLVGDPAYAQNQLRQDLWRAGHAHAGVLLLLSLIALRYVDETQLSERMKRVVWYAIPAAAILLPAAFFLSVLSPDASEPNAMIYLAYLGATSLGVGLLVLGVGLIWSGAR
ncbi:MAG TPA: hypothetical protein VFU22_11195 [Roseiflexaceae bacterium]|nr:hypothetical protein [Roseiflexaceae bacterium]